MDDADALSWTSWSGSTWERVLLASGVGNEADGMVPLNDITSDVKRALERLKTSMVRAGMVGGALKGGLNLFALLARARKRGVRRAAAADAVRDTVSFAAFLVAFSGVYVSVDEGLSLRYGKQRSKSWRAAVAGAVAGPTLLLADGVGRGPAADPRRHHGLATYVWLRSIVLLVRCAIKRRDRLTETQRRLLAPFASDHADVGLMMASATVILSCFILKPEALRGAYASFLDKHGGKSVAHYRAAQRVVSAADGEETSAALAAAADRLYPNDCPARDALLAAAAKDPAAQRAARASFWGLLLHPGQSALGHAARFWVSSLPRSVAVNLPIYAVPALVVHRGRLLGPDGPKLATRAAVGCARSSAFLSAYCALAWLGPELVQRVAGTARPWTIACGVPAAGSRHVHRETLQETRTRGVLRVEGGGGGGAVRGELGVGPATREGMAGRRRDLLARRRVHHALLQRGAGRVPIQIPQRVGFRVRESGTREAERASRRERVSAHVDALADGVAAVVAAEAERTTRAAEKREVRARGEFVGRERRRDAQGTLSERRRRGEHTKNTKRRDGEDETTTAECARDFPPGSRAYSRSRSTRRVGTRPARA